MFLTAAASGTQLSHIYFKDWHFISFIFVNITIDKAVGGIAGKSDGPEYGGNAYGIWMDNIANYAYDNTVVSKH